MNNKDENMPTLNNAFARIFISSLLLLIVGLSAIDSLAAGQATKRVFILQSYHKGYTFSDNAMRGIDDVFDKSDIKIENYVTYMDVKRIPPTPQYFSQLKNLISEGYRGVRFDAVLACDNDALKFMRKYRDELFPGVPVVFTGINDFDEGMLDGRRDLTGTIERSDYAGTISLAQKLRPETKNIVVVTDKTTTGKALRSELEKVRPDLPQSLKFTDLSFADMTLDELTQKLSRLNSDSIVFLLQHSVDRYGNSHPLKESTLLLAKSSSVPVFVVSDSRMGLGVLGGHLVSGYSQGETAAQIVVKILGGTDVRSIPVMLDSPNKYMFDYRVMQRFNISERNLPQGSILINKPVSVLDEYRPQMFAILGAFIVLSGLVVILLLEIRRRKQSEEALRESERKYRNIYEDAVFGIYQATPEGRFISVNDAFARMAGYESPEELIDTVKNIGSQLYVNPDERKIFMETIAANGIIKDFEIEFYKKDRSKFWNLVNARAVKDEQGRIIYYEGMAEDVTQRRQAEEENRMLEERLNRAEKMEALGQLAGGVAHDLNNVLGIVVGYSEMLLDGVDKSSPIRHGLENVMSGGLKAAAIVDDLLTLARRGVPSRSILNLNKIIADCQKSPEFAHLSLHHPSVKIKTDLEADLLNIAGSSVHLGKSLYNLVSNASEAMLKGGAVAIKTTNQYLDKPIQGYDQIREGDYVLLSVSDTGEGISAHDLKRIFEPFYTKKIMGRSGTGLGLAVVWGTVKDHQGYINVASEEGKGSIFTLYFPVTREEITPDSVAVGISEYMGNGESILVVDDVKEQRDLATSMLRALNYNVSSVSSGEEAVSYLQEHEIDLMLLDMIMDPGMDGLDTYKRILEIRPRQKAIIVSGFSESDRVRAAKGIGVGAYVKKPYIKEKLGLAVRKELDRE